MLPLLQRLTSPPKQTLTVVQPTPSTVCFTVSTRSVPRTLSAQLRHHVGHVLRVVIGILALVVVFLKWETTAARPWLVNADAGGSDEWVVYALLRELSWRYILPSVAIILYLVLRRGYTEESLLILRGLGLQTSTSSSTYLHSATTRFIPTTSIQDIFIHEAFKGFEVRFYLAIVVKGEEDVVVVFPGLLPRREVLERVWRGTREGLYECGRKAGELQ